MLTPLIQGETVVDGVRLTYLERPASHAGSKAPMLLLHGLIASSSTFKGLIAELPQDRRIVALDLPGADLPARPRKSDLSLRGLARLVHDFSQALDLGQPVILGHSHGGAIALQIAASFPEDLSGLVLLCPAHPFLHRERPLIAFYNSWLGHIFARALPYVPGQLQGIGFRRVLGPAGRKVGVDFRPYRESLGQPEAVARVLRLLKSWNADMDALGSQIEEQPILAPALFLWGDADPVVPISTAPALQQHLRRWEQVALPGVGHLPNDEAPAPCGGAIQTWLGRQAEMLSSPHACGKLPKPF
jgi:pimeloyl-ACP methyl ester carboxylesterase